MSVCQEDGDADFNYFSILIFILIHFCGFISWLMHGYSKESDTISIYTLQPGSNFYPECPPAAGAIKPPLFAIKVALL